MDLISECIDKHFTHSNEVQDAEALEEMVMTDRIKDVAAYCAINPSARDLLLKELFSKL